MKKFGTPNGAAPGNENEKVGFADVGTPPLLRGDCGFVGFLELFPELPGVLGFEGLDPFDPEGLFGAGCEEGCCCLG